MSQFIRNMQFFLEKHAFGVCSRIGSALGISTSVIRLYFIYISFIAFGSPIILYLAIAFWMNVKRYIRKAYDFREVLLG